MDVDSCIKAYMELSKEIFPHENFLARSKVIKFGKAVVGRARFDASVLEKHIKAIVKEQLKKVPEHEGNSDEDLENMRLDFATVNDYSGPKCKV